MDIKYPPIFSFSRRGNYWKGPSQVNQKGKWLIKRIWSVYCSGYSFGEHGSARGNPFITSTDSVIPEVAKRLSGIRGRRRFTGYPFDFAQGGEPVEPRIATPSRPA